MHDDSVNAASRRDGDTLNYGGYKGHAYAGERAEGKAADKYGDVRGVILKKADGGEDGEVDEVDKDYADGGHDGHGGETAGAGFVLHVFSLLKMKKYALQIYLQTHKENSMAIQKGNNASL